MNKVEQLAHAGRSHIDEVRDLVHYLERQNIALFEHDYLMHVFGSFSLVIGTQHDRLKFSWDGREFFLDTSRGSFQSLGGDGVWNHLSNKRLANGVGLFEELRTQANATFAMIGPRGMPPHLKRRYWAGYILMIAAVVMLFLLALFVPLR